MRLAELGEPGAEKLKIHRDQCRFRAIEGIDGDKTKVAVLGGGVGSIAAAFELTATTELRERFEVTVHQLGWRIGGKGASGRNMAAGGRIEEHGLHIWFGFYDNAFRLMREAYQELGRAPGDPLATLEDAFKPCDQIVLYDRQGDDWTGFAFSPPRNFARPGVPGDMPTFWEVAAAASEWALGRWRELHNESPHLATEPAPVDLTPDWFDDIAGIFASELLGTALVGAEHLLHLATRLAGERARSAAPPTPGHKYAKLYVELLTGFRDWLWEFVVKERCDSHPNLRLFFTMLDVVASTAAGIVTDGVIDNGFGAIDDYEWCEWLRRHGAHEVTLGRTPAERSPMLRAVYDVAFGYVDGVIDKANVAAGTATNDLVRLCFSYRGSLMWKMQAGMGDTVFTPFYEVLRKRGVKFRFFDAVTNLGLGVDGRTVDTIDVVSQVDLAVPEYDPLVDVAGLDCWPSEPQWGQLADGEKLRAQGVDFENDANPLGRPVRSLRRGVDFDQVVLGISVAALPPICGELIAAHEPFARMIESSETVQTQAFQLWLSEPGDALGWAHDMNSVAGCYVEPLDTYCDMSHLLPREGWGESDGVRSIAYFCGVIDDRAGETPAETTARAKQSAIEFLSADAGALWPDAVAGGSGSPLRWELLADPEERENELRFDSQFWRANTSLTERYVLTPAAKVKDRLRSDESGFENLVLAGDWTDNGVNGGCVEAAAISGVQAARALTGLDTEIPGESRHWIARPVADDSTNGGVPRAPGAGSDDHDARDLVLSAAGFTAELIGTAIGRVIRDVTGLIGLGRRLF
jgi:uncharacterized protein with NAD-binding domain and iron-sulfur cluster